MLVSCTEGWSSNSVTIVIELQHNSTLDIVLKGAVLAVIEVVLRIENTLSTAADDGWHKKNLLAGLTPV